MGRITGMKWEKSVLSRPVHNIISSDFPKYIPQPWKFMQGPAYMSLLLSYEYQRLWKDERDIWNKRMYPENTKVNVDIIKRYVLSFKNNVQPPKPEKKKPFKIKKFQEIGKSIETKRPSDDKAMAYLKKEKAPE